MDKHLKPLTDIPDHILLGVARRFMEGEKAEDIATWVRSTGYRATRERIFNPLLRMAIDRGIFQILATPEHDIGVALSDTYGHSAGDLHVVRAVQPEVREQVSLRAVEVIVELILELGQLKERVHIGLGGGVTIWETARLLAKRLAAEAFLPRLALHAISSGFDIRDPRTAPITFMSDFYGLDTDIETFALFAPAIVDIADYKAVKDSPSVRESAREAKKIDIVITSLAAETDEHGALNRLGAVGRKQGFRKGPLRRAGWVGDVQYHPYSEVAPIEADAAGARAVTLLELEELHDLAQAKNKHVVVIASPCATCKQPKTEAVRPLLESPQLKVWTKLVLDMRTAKQLLRPKPTKPGRKRRAKAA